ncbi:HigA protein (antitoxin to HigB) [Candidatus Burkholderia pumila]|uniref:HigA protein (Antitoxin to HigB) n=1 Tax=Candidatus Burkholderia pumila TaxID=1090375 RepID=A0ABR5HNW8_9BURK|nr:HigA protein (antitoxin to HigB) [Candidatus Burkholderia pumila]
MNRMHNPPHPGGILAETVSALGLTVMDAAEQLGVSRVALSRVLHEYSSLSSDMALRIEAWLDIERAETWLAMQTAYDL